MDGEVRVDEFDLKTINLILVENETVLFKGSLQTVLLLLKAAIVIL